MEKKRHITEATLVSSRRCYLATVVMPEYKHAVSHAY